MMIDPQNITDYSRSMIERQELLLFAIAVVNKNADRIVQQLEKFLCQIHTHDRFHDHFEAIRYVDECFDLEREMIPFGFGNHKMKARAFSEIAHKNINLRNPSVEELESVHGIGMKTSRFFLLHSVPNARVAVLDTHILEWMRRIGLEIPKGVPSKRRYLELEKSFLFIADTLDTPPADLDLLIWRKMREGGLTNGKS